MSEAEREYWCRILAELQEVMTVAAIAKEIGVLVRQVWRWKSGHVKPAGLNAVNIYLLHVKRCPDRRVTSETRSEMQVKG